MSNSVEMTVKAAFFKAYGLGLSDEIGRADRALAEAAARGYGITVSGPHDFEAWARLLVEFNRRRVPRPTYDLAFGMELVNRARTAYQHWRPEMRYRITRADPDEVETVRSSACWFLRNSRTL